MKEHLSAYIMLIQPQTQLSEQALRHMLEWLKTYYDNWYQWCRDYTNRGQLFSDIEQYTQNWIAVMSYTDICYEYNDLKIIEALLNNPAFNDSKNTITMYIELRRQFKISSNDELLAWSAYITSQSQNVTKSDVKTQQARTTSYTDNTEKKQAKQSHNQNSIPRHSQYVKKAAVNQAIQMNNQKKENKELNVEVLVRTLPRIEEYHNTSEMKKQALKLSIQIMSNRDNFNLIKRFCKTYETPLNRTYIEPILNHNIEVVEYAFIYSDIVIFKSKDLSELINSISDTIENYDFNKKRKLREMLDFIYENLKW